MAAGAVRPKVVGAEWHAKTEKDQKSHNLFADLVAIAGWLHPIPFRTRP